jgi:CelD/BcsL family acetyltransferase involved in cellulose biosynthesis
MSDLALSGIARRGIVATAAKEACAPGFAADVLFGAEAYQTLRGDWERLAAQQEQAVIFQTPTLLSAWARQFAPGRARSLATVVVRQEGQAVLIWPLIVEQCGLFRIASGAGSPIGQYDEILLDPGQDAAEAFATALRTLSATVRPDLVSLERVRADSALRTAIAVPPLASCEAAPFTDLSKGMEGVWSSRKPRVARQQKKRLRAFANHGDVEFRMAASPAEAEAWLCEALALKRDWLRSTGRVSRAFMKQSTTNCLVELVRSLSGADASPRVVVSRLSLDGRTAAIEAGFVHGRTYHLYLGAFAPECARLGPGNVLTQKVLEWCAGNGILRYDMLAPRSRHKREWQTGEVTIADFALPATMRGRLYVAVVMKRLAPALRRMFYALPPAIRSSIAGLALRL